MGCWGGNLKPRFYTSVSRSALAKKKNTEPIRVLYCPLLYILAWFGRKLPSQIHLPDRNQKMLGIGDRDFDQLSNLQAGTSHNRLRQAQA